METPSVPFAVPVLSTRPISTSINGFVGVNAPATVELRYTNSPSTNPSCVLRLRSRTLPIRVINPSPLFAVIVCVTTPNVLCASSAVDAIANSMFGVFAVAPTILTICPSTRSVAVLFRQYNKTS